jgi:DNA-binding NtrC family response regulator
MPYTILLVDDNEMVRKFVLMALSGLGHGEVLEANDAAQAIKISEAYHEPIEVLLTDVVMPGEMNGHDLARKISETRPETKILLMSGYDETAACALREGWRFIHKPFSTSALIETVEQVLHEPAKNMNLLAVMEHSIGFTPQTGLRKQRCGSVPRKRGSSAS